MKIHQQDRRNALARSQDAVPRGAPLPGGLARVIDLTQDSLPATLGGHPFAIVDFCDPASPGSREFATAFGAAAARHPDLLFGRVDATRERAIIEQLGVRALPTLMIFRDNVVVHASTGRSTPAALDEVLAAARALDMDEVRRQVAGAAAAAPAGAGCQASHRDLPADAHVSIEACLRPSVSALLADAAPRMASGRMLAIRDAFEPDFAERMHRSLDNCRAWRLHEGGEGHFHFRHHNLYDAEAFPADLARCSQVFGSSRTKAWASRLSGRPCEGPAEFSASLYLPGDHSLPHNDVAAADGEFHRQVAYVWHLARDWRPEWGGALYWCSKATYLPPAFNTLYLFNVGPESNHFVTHVSPYAQGRRFAINGWWTGPAPTPSPATRTVDRIAAGDAEIQVH